MNAYSHTMKRSSLACLAALTLSLPSVSAAQSSEPAGAAQAQPWVANRDIGEGIGIKAGDFEIHPGISGEFGFDSNFFQRSTSAIDEATFGAPAPSLRLRVTPSVSLRTLDRRVQAADDSTEDDRPITLSVSGAASYNEFIGLDDAADAAFDASRNVEGGAGAEVEFLPGRVWSGDLGVNYSYIFDPSNQGGLTSDFSRHVIGVGGGIGWAPGGGAFEWRLLEYGTRFTLFDQTGTNQFDNNNHQLTTSGRWKFLTKTALLYDATFGLYRYGPNATLNDGESLQTRLGLSGLLTTRISLLVMGGWASSFYHDDNGLPRNYDDLLAAAEVRWFITSGNEAMQEGFANVGASSLAGGYSRTFNDGYLGDFYQSDRFYAQFQYLIASMVLTTFDAGVNLVSYPDFLLNGTENPGFSEVRLNLKAFGEYRPLDTLGINLTLEYDENLSEVVDGGSYEDDLSFSRFRGFLGVRWFM